MPSVQQWSSFLSIRLERQSFRATSRRMERLLKRQNNFKCGRAEAFLHRFPVFLCLPEIKSCWKNSRFSFQKLHKPIYKLPCRSCTVIHMVADEKFAGYLVLSDTVRTESAGMIAQLKNLNVQSVLLTGDHENAAIASQLQMTEVHANCLPEDKMRWIADEQQKQESVCMMEDGVNDAPALKKANVGIAMGGIGSDIAVDAADIALVDDEVKELPHLLGLSKRMMVTIKCNLTFSMSLNFLAIILAMTGILNPVVGALVHNAGSVLVILNSAWLLKWKRRNEK